MDDDLLGYYNAELAFLRELGAEFARTYPKVAGRLLLEEDKCEDPHVERLLEGFALLTARVRKKIEDDFPEITDALLGLLYPHYLAPIPSMSVVQFVLDPQQADQAAGLTIDRGSVLVSRLAGEVPCRFRTTYPITLWPIEVKAAHLDTSRITAADKPPGAVAVLRLELICTGQATFADWQMESLRFFLDGEGPLASALYESLLNDALQVVARVPGPNRRTESVPLPPDAIRPVGFGRDEGMVPYPARSFVGYRLLQEYFAFPEKFLFFDLTGWERLAARGPGNSVELWIYLRRAPRVEQPVQPENFRPNCAPIVNLFPLLAEPIPLIQTRADYHVVPDVHHPLATEVYSVDQVTCTASFLAEPERYAPLYSVGHAMEESKPRAFWYARRRPSERRDDPGTEIDLAFVDLNFQPKAPANGTISVRLTCTNRDLPTRLPYGGDRGDFELEAQALVSRVRCLRKPTKPLRPRLGRGGRWRLISHLALNYLSLAESDGGPETLRELLLLYDFADSPVTRQQISGITRVASRRIAARTGRAVGTPVSLGLEVAIDFDEAHYVGSGAFLLASVLERFFGLYVSINSFSQLVVTTRQRQGILKRWPPRAGERTLL